MAPKLQIYKHWVDNLLARFVPRPQTLLDLIYETKSLISGSIVMQMILGEEWLDSDVDIYVQAAEEKNKLGSYLLEIGYERALNDFTRYPDIDVENWVRCTGEKIQLIIAVNSDYGPSDRTPMELIRHFDLRVCRSYHDGKTIYGYNLGFLLRKEFGGIYTYEHTADRVNSRIAKYKQRGFKDTLKGARMRDDGYQIVDTVSIDRLLDDICFVGMNPGGTFKCPVLSRKGVLFLELQNEFDRFLSSCG